MLYMAGAFVLYALTSLCLQSDASAMFFFALFVASFGIGWLMHDWCEELWLCLGAALVASTALTYPFLQWGLFGNPNAIGCAFALCFAACVTYRCWFLLPFQALGVLWSGSRGAIAVSGAVILAKLFNTHRATAMLLASGAVLFILLDHRGSGSFFHRLGVWQDTINSMTLWGHGLGNYLGWYTSLPVQRNLAGFATHAYNDFLELLWTFGIGVAPLWLFLLWSLGAPTRERLILLTFLGLGLSFFPLFLWPLALPFAFTLGAQAHARQSLQTLAPATA